MGVASVTVFGVFRALNASGEVAKFRTSRAAEVVARLTLHRTGKMSRSALAQEIWPDASPSDQLMNLRPALHYAKIGLGAGPFLEVAREDVYLNIAHESDWHEVQRLEARLVGETEQDTRVMTLFSLYEILRKPLLEGWDRAWIEPYHMLHARQQSRVLKGLVEELGGRGEVKAALEYAHHLAALDPFSEEAVRLQLRLLAQVDRLAEAQVLFRDFRKRTRETFDLDVSAELKELAKKVIAGGFSATNTKPATSVQLEMVHSLLEMLVESAPERLLALLSAPEVNWAVVLYGAELRGLLETVMDRTSGWSTDRAGAAKRLLQLHTQEGEWQRVQRLATSMLDSPRLIDQVAAQNYLGEFAINEGQHEVAVKHYVQAQELAIKEGNDYLAGVSVANHGLANMAFGEYEAALEQINSAFEVLTKRGEPNARYSLGRIISTQAHLYEIIGAADEAENKANSWLRQASTDEVLLQDSQGLAVLGLIRAKRGDPSASEWAIQALERAVASRRKPEMAMTGLIVCQTAKILGIEEAASNISDALLPWLLEFRRELLPFDRFMLEAAGAVLDRRKDESTRPPATILVELKEALEIHSARMPA